MLRARWLDVYQCGVSADFVAIHSQNHFANYLLAAGMGVPSRHVHYFTLGRVMSIFGNIMSKVFGHAGAGEGSLSGATAVGASAPPVQPSTTSAPGAGATGTAPVQSRAQNVDVAAVLDGLASKRKERLDWKHSIVDTMKLLDMDSSLSARKELANELHYSGDTNDSGTMNVTRGP
jgi:hypothetical protein